LDVANGSAVQNRVYCSKGGDFFEFGDLPIEKSEAQQKGGQGNKARYTKAIEHARAGNVNLVESEDPQMFLLHGIRLESLYAPTPTPLQGILEHEWWVGPSGSGKSRLLWELYPLHFAKALNKWWDGFKHNDVVAIEEWSPKNDCTASSLKKWADRYPFPGEIKGGCLQGLRPKKIIVLSNYTPQQCFLNSEDLDPILRRFTVINFPRGETQARDRAAEFHQPIDIIDDITFQDNDFELPDLDLDTLMDDMS